MANRFVELLTKSAQQSPQTIALPEILDRRVFDAARKLIENRCVKKIYTLCDEALFMSFAKSEGINIKDQLGYFANAAKDEANAFPDDTLLQKAGRLLAAGTVESVLAGATHTTADVIRAAISTIGLRPGLKTISGSFLMHREQPGLSPHTFLFADCGVVIEPTVKQLLDIASASVETWNDLKQTDDAPVVAFLSFSTKGSARHPSVDRMQEAARLFQQEYPGVDADGEMQFDAAFDLSIGQRKCPGSRVPGRANIFLFPDLNTGNIAYKITQRLALFDAYGPILQGTGKVFSDLSRGASSDDIFVSALINQVRAKAQLTSPSRKS